MYPLKLIPAFKEIIWGGRRLIDEFKMDCPLGNCAEAWTLSCHKDGASIVSNGEYSGLTLPEAIEAMGKGCLGSRGNEFDYFPILIKFIDALDDLSVQVHPDDAYALENSGEYGKTEMWYVVDCDDESALIYGFNRKISKTEFEKRINDNTLTEVLDSVSVKKGDCFFIDSGTIHAIGKGLLIAEIQQNSNQTFRVYDYDRRDAEGNARELKIKEALDVTVTAPPVNLCENRKVEVFDGYSSSVLASCQYFTTVLYDIEGFCTIEAGSDSFCALTVIDAEDGCVLSYEDMPVAKGDSFFVPSGCPPVEIKGKCRLILSKV